MFIYSNSHLNVRTRVAMTTRRILAENVQENVRGGDVVAGAMG